MTGARPAPEHAGSDPTVPVGNTRRYAGDYAAHEHAFAQVLFGLEGRLELEIGGRAERVEADSGLIVPAGVAHAFASETPSRLWVVDAPPSRELARTRRFRRPAGFSTTLGAADALARAVGAPRALPRRALERRVLEAALADSLHEAWPTRRMAALYALSAPRFHARWLAAEGRTPQAWLRAHRLDRAERLLQVGRSLDFAAASVGYASASALCHALGRERGGAARALRARTRAR